MTPPAATTMAALLARYRGFVIDAYGVLVDAGAALPGAAALLDLLDRRGAPWVVATNDASRLPATCARRYQALGLPVPPDRVLTSGELLVDWMRAKVPPGAATCVLGTPDSVAYAQAGGARVVELAPGMTIDCLAVCDDAGFEFLAGCEHAMSAAVRALAAARPLQMVLPNPDLVYPKADGEIGLTAGSIALVIEAVLARRFPGERPRFARLGKPERHLFDRAVDRLGLPRDQILVVGDQLETDIAAATAAGLDSVLVAGISRWIPESAVTPTWLVESLR